jgi:hypothetical protein
LLIWRNSLLVLNLGLDIINSVRRLHIKRDGLAYSQQCFISAVTKIKEKQKRLNGGMIRNRRESE